MGRLSETVNTIPPEAYVSDRLRLKTFDVVEINQIIGGFSEVAVKGLQSPIKSGLGPFMLRFDVSPPETPFTKLVGKKAIGIDIGGTNLRMSVGEIDKNGFIKPTERARIQEISIVYHSLDDFFEMLLENGLGKLLKENADLPLACIFSFPGTGIVTENGVDIKMLGNMSKGWRIDGSEGKNLGQELNRFLQRKDEALKKKKLVLDKRTFGKRRYFIANDTAALIRYDDFGVVCASGYNWSMVIKKEKLGEGQEQPGRIIINTEAGQAASAPKIPIITDRLIGIIAEEEKVSAAIVPLRDEYQVSGKYLGRTLGLVVNELRDKYRLFTSVNNTVFLKSFVVSNILSAGENGDWKEVEKNFQTNHDFSDQEKNLLIQIASALRDRSAQIVAGHLVALWQTGCPEKDHLKISSDGPIIQNMLGWKEKFMEEIESITEKKLTIKVRETAYQGKMRDFRGIFDVMYQAIEYFARENK